MYLLASSWRNSGKVLDDRALCVHDAQECVTGNASVPVPFGLGLDTARVLSRALLVNPHRSLLWSSTLGEHHYSLTTVCPVTTVCTEAPIGDNRQRGPTCICPMSDQAGHGPDTTSCS
eukprot:998966-Rhodomonas_salina.1